MLSDLSVEVVSSALEGVEIDVVVTGSIAAVESVRFIRALRRLGASVQPWASKGAQRFVTVDSLSWAANRKCISEFSGDISHIATKQVCLVIPASASFLSKLVGGISDSPGLALVHSQLGRNQQVMFLPSMHQSLSDSPFVAANIECLSKRAIMLQPRVEEGKCKFPEPASLADQVAHRINEKKYAGYSSLVVMGTTRGYIDDVRYVSNYSSGKLGSRISEELYRNGLKTNVISGPVQVEPNVYSDLVRVRTNKEMQEAISAAEPYDSAIMLASVLDFEPDKHVEGKIRSQDQAGLNLTLKRSEKLIAGINPRGRVKVGFKLESSSGTTAEIQKIAKSYLHKYKLSMLIVNDMMHLQEGQYQASAFEDGKSALHETSLPSRESAAKYILGHINSARGAALS